MAIRRMQCKAIELLEILIEETSKDSSTLIDAISKDLKKRHVISFIEGINERVS